MKSMTKTSNKLEVALILHKIQEDRAKDLALSWWWKLIPFGSTLASNISQFEVYAYYYLFILNCIYQLNLKKKVGQVGIGKNSNPRITRQKYGRYE